MKELSPQQNRFYKSWTIQRRNKWGYVLYHGSVHWAAIGLIIALADESFNFGNIKPVNFILKILFFATIGIFSAYRYFRINEKAFQFYLAQDEEINKGVATLKNEKLWVYDNLTLSCEEESRMIVRNNLYWLKEEQPTEKQISACLQTLRDDITRLRWNKKFDAFAENNKIEFELYNNLFFKVSNNEI